MIFSTRNNWKCIEWLEMNNKEIQNQQTEMQCSNTWPHAFKTNDESWKRELKWFFSRIHALQHTKKFVTIFRMLVVKKKSPEICSKIHNHRFHVLTFEIWFFFKNFEPVRSVFWNLRMILSDSFDKKSF